MEDLKNRILQQVYDNFVNSLGYNGCPIYKIAYDCTQNELLQCLIELIKEGKIEIITGDVGNTYIKSFDAESIEKQITQLPSLSPFDYCIYPTEKVLENKRDVSSFTDRPFSKMLALGKPQLKCRFFNILHFRSRITLRMDIGYFFQLQRTFKGGGVVVPTTEIKEVAGIGVYLRQVLDFVSKSQHIFYI